MNRFLSSRPCRFAAIPGLAAAGFAMAGCQALPIAPARMVLPAPLEAAAPLSFEGLSARREGRFVFEGQPVQFRRMGDALSVFDALRLDRVSLQFEHGSAGAATQGRCDGRAGTATPGVLDAALQPFTLQCRFTGAMHGELALREPRLAAAGTRQAREGQARFADGSNEQRFEVRSEHALQGSPLPLAHPAGYRITLGGRDIAAIELTADRPSLRRVEGLDETTRRAVTQLALALGLLFDPAVTAQ